METQAQVATSLEVRAVNGPRQPGGQRLPYLPGLDGLRAVAVIAVLLYHANLSWIPGGFLGVEMFFVISGYLITSLLLAEWGQTGRIDLKTFWLRRARRLLPALFLLLLAVGGYAVVFLPNEVASLRGDLFSTAAYVNNWFQIFSHKSYFESVGRPSLLRHMWSLAVEEQFYLVWPLLFLAVARLRRRYALVLILAGLMASSLAMAAMYHPNADPSRAYYGTDTRAAGLLLGILLAFLWPPGAPVVTRTSWSLDLIGLTGLGTVIACFLLLNEFQPFLYRGGFTLTGLLTAELLAVAVHPDARLLPRLLGWAPLRWVGLRSYGLYLWHFPVFMLTRPQLDVPWGGGPLLVGRLVVTGLVAGLSYRWVETPIRTGALARAWKAWQEAQGPRRNWFGLGWASGATALVAACGLLVVFLVTAIPPAPPVYLTKAHKPRRVAMEVPAQGAAATGDFKTNAGPPLVPPSTISAQKLAEALLLAPAHGSTSPAPSAPLSPAQVVTRLPVPISVTAIGDSVMEGVGEELVRRFGTNTIVDADQGRLPWNTPAIARNLRAAGKIKPVVVLQIGNNGFLSREVFGQIMAECKDARRVVVLNLKVPRRWESPNNSMLASAIKSYTNAVLVDWHAASADRPGYFWNDGLHTRPEGTRAYAELVTRAVGMP